MAGGESSNPLTLRFVGDFTLGDVCEPVLAACRSFALSEEDAARLAVVIEELLANLFDHGGAGSAATLEVCLSLGPSGVEIDLADSGCPFDPRDAPVADSVPARGGGAGLSIVRRWAKLRSYEPGPPLNRLKLLLPVGLRAVGGKKE